MKVQYPDGHTEEGILKWANKAKSATIFVSENTVESSAGNKVAVRRGCPNKNSQCFALVLATK